MNSWPIYQKERSSIILRMSIWKKPKKILGNVACISGNLSITLLQTGTREQVSDHIKWLIDTCAPGGGYIFDTNAFIDNAKRENIETMFEVCRRAMGESHNHMEHMGKLPLNVDLGGKVAGYYGRRGACFAACFAEAVAKAGGEGCRARSEHGCGAGP